MRIHLAGRKIILIVATLLFFVNLLLFLFVSISIWFIIVFFLSLIFLAFIIFFFRYDNRVFEEHVDDVVLSAADGQIVAIEQVYEPLFSFGEAIQISTFMSLFNVHLNWVPISGVIEKLVYYPGKKYCAKAPKASMLNEMVCVLLRTSKGNTILIKQIAGIFARRIVSYVKEGQHCKLGDELGFIRFGSRVDILVPKNSQVKVSVGQKVKGLKTVLLVLPDNNTK